MCHERFFFRSACWYSLVSLTGINPDKTLSKPLIGNELTVSLAPKLQHNGLRDMLILEKMHVSKRGTLSDTKCSRARDMDMQWQRTCVSSRDTKVTLKEWLGSCTVMVSE